MVGRATEPIFRVYRLRARAGEAAVMGRPRGTGIAIHIMPSVRHPLLADERVAHCVVGVPRALFAPCQQRALLDNWIGAFAPARSYIFAAFATATRSGMFNATHSSPLEHWPIQPSELAALADAIGAVNLTVLDTLPTRECHAADAAESRSYAVSSVMMGNVRRCFQSIVQYEQRDGISFDYVSRIRPDAVFFARFQPPPRELLTTKLVLPIGGLGGQCHRCANDHLALAPRHLAAKYFEEISLRVDDCTTGWKFITHHWVASTAPSPREHATAQELLAVKQTISGHAHRGDVGYNTHVGIGFAMAAVGLSWHAHPWSYALAARHCCVDPTAGTSARCGYRGSEMPCESTLKGSSATSCAVPTDGLSELASSCAGPLACHRLRMPLGAMLHGRHNLSQYMSLQTALAKECETWRCRAGSLSLST